MYDEGIILILNFIFLLLLISTAKDTENTNSEVKMIAVSDCMDYFSCKS